jgi:hypothetical protein
MVKKESKKVLSKENPKHITASSEEINKILVENFVSLQRTMTNMAEKFDKLSDNISGLLKLFEISARSFMDKQPVPDLEKDKEFLNKLNLLIDQNKTIAKGLTLMEGKIRERLYGSDETEEEQLKMPLMPPNFSNQQSNMNVDNRFKKLPRF